MPGPSFGQLRSWGNLTGTGGVDLLYFSGAGSLTGSVRTSWPTGFHPKIKNPLVDVGQAYPYDSAGYSAMPLEDATLTYTVQLVANPCCSDDQALYYLRSAWAQIWDFVMGTYTVEGLEGVFGGLPGASGQRGWLVLRDERLDNDTLYKAKARCLVPAEFDLVAGQPHTLTMSLVFALLSDFEAYDVMDTRRDTFVRADQGDFGTATGCFDWALGNFDISEPGATAYVNSHHGIITGDPLGESPMLLAGPALASADSEVAVRWSMTGGHLASGVAMVLRALLDGSQYALVGITLDGNWELDLHTPDDDDTQTGTWAGALLSDTLWTRFRVSGHTYHWRTWVDGTTEPSSWDGTYTSSVHVPAGAAGLAGVFFDETDALHVDLFHATTL